MTRIIGGEAGGRRIKTPTGEATRPTTDRVREALFSAVDAAFGSLHGLRFLDVYAGSGAVGLEARSRGAGVVTLVEHDRRTAGLIRENIKTLGMSGVDVVVAPRRAPWGSRPVRRTTSSSWTRPTPRRAPRSRPTCRRSSTRGGWRTRRVVVVERSTRGDGPTWPRGLVGDRSRRYGETTLWYGHATAQIDP